MTLPAGIVSRMQAGDFGVPMSDILPCGYISPQTICNDRRWRVTDIAESISRNGFTRALKIHMGRVCPVVTDGHHLYVAAIIAGVACLPVEITFPEDVRDVTRWVMAAEKPQRAWRGTGTWPA